MKNKRYPTAFVFGASLAAALSGAALRTLAYFLIYDAEVGYFRTGFFSTLLYIYPIAAALALAALLTLRIPKNCAPGDFVIAPGSARAAAGIEIAAAAALLALTIFDIATALRVGENMSYVCAATTLIGCLYLAPRMKQPALRALGGMALVVRALQTVCIEYFDWSTTLNNPVKSFRQFTLLCGALFIIEHIRFKRSAYNTRKLLILSAATAILGITDGASGIISTAAAVHAVEAFSPFFLSLVLGLCALGAITQFRAAEHTPPETPAQQEQEPQQAPIQEPQD